MGDPVREVREEAADLLACLASLRDEEGGRTTMAAPGRWSGAGRAAAFMAVMNVDEDAFDGWRELYAEAEAQLREVSRG